METGRKRERTGERLKKIGGTRAAVRGRSDKGGPETKGKWKDAKKPVRYDVNAQAEDEAHYGGRRGRVGDPDNE